jgi:hypothetical protein
LTASVSLSVLSTPKELVLMGTLKLPTTSVTSLLSPS